MTRQTAFLCTMFLSWLPALVQGQTNNNVSSTSVPCCGQSATTTQTPAEITRQTQLNLQAILLKKAPGDRLQAGNYLITKSSDGYQFRATVSQKGAVDGWYIANRDGKAIVYISANQGPLGGQGDKINTCVNLYSQAISSCLSLGGFPNRQQLCLAAAWDSFFACLSRASGNTLTRQ